MSIKEVIFSMMIEALENIDEAVEVSHDRYIRSHGKKASGSGGWFFTHKSGEVNNLDDEKEVHFKQGKFSDAAKSAKKWAKENGHRTVYVMESIEQVDEEREMMKPWQVGEMRDQHQKWANHFKSVGNEEGYKAHQGVVDHIKKKFSEKSDRYTHGRDWSAKTLNKISEKAFREHRPTAMKEEVEQIDELAPNTLHRYIKKATGEVAARAISAVTPNQSPETKKHASKLGNRIKGITSASGRLSDKANQNEEVELDEAEKPNQYIEVTNKFTGAKSHHEVHPTKAFAALNRHNSLWSTKSARIVSGKEAEEIRASKMKKEEVELDEGIKEKIGGIIRRQKEKEYPLLQNRRDVAADKAAKAYAKGDEKKGNRYMAWRDNNMKKEEVELDEQTMPGNVALRLVDRHQAAAFHHKKNGNMKGYAAHLKVAERIEDAVIRAGRDMPVKSKQLEAASDKAFKDHPHRIVRNEEVEQIDEISRDLARSYIRKVSDKNNTGEAKPKEVLKRSPGVALAGKKAYGIGGEPKVRATE